LQKPLLQHLLAFGSRPTKYPPPSSLPRISWGPLLVRASFLWPPFTQNSIFLII